MEVITRSLSDFESVSKGLQFSGKQRVNRYAARNLFDDLLNDYETDERQLPHLHKNGAIVNNRHFENGIVKIQGGIEHELSPAEKLAVKIFLKPVAIGEPLPPVVPVAQSFFQRSVNNSLESKRARIEISKYRSTEHVSTTSNVCERLFSAAKLNMSHLRSSMDPYSLNIILFLKANKSLWEDKSLIDEIINDEEQIEVDDQLNN